MLFFVRIFPWEWSSYLFDRLGLLAFYLVKKERIKTINGLTTAYGAEKSSGEIYGMAKKVFTNFGQCCS